MLNYSYYTKKYLLKQCGPQIRLCLFTFRPIALKQLKGLTTIDTLIWLSGPEVTHPTELRQVLESQLWQGFLCLNFCFIVVVFEFFRHNIFYFFWIVHSSSIINIFKNYDRCLGYQDTGLASLTSRYAYNKDNMNVQLINKKDNTGPVHSIRSTG